MLLVLVVMLVPFLPVHLPCCLCFYNHAIEKRPKNILNLGVTILLTAVIIILLPYVLNFANWFSNLALIKKIISWFPSYVVYGTTLFRAIFANIAYCLAVLIVLALLIGIENVGSIFKKKWSEWKEKRKKAKQEDPASMDETEQTGLPSRLLPPAERESQPKTITVKTDVDATSDNGTETERPRRKKRANSGKGASPVELFRRLRSYFYIKDGNAWYATAQSLKAAIHIKHFLVITGIMYLTIFFLLMIPVFFPIQNVSQKFYDGMVTLAKNCYMVPSAALVLITELFWFLNGAEMPEEKQKELAERKNRKREHTVDMDALERDMMCVFAGGYAVKRFNSADIDVPVLQKGLGMVESDPELQPVASFVKMQGLELNKEYLQGVKMMQQGKNVLFQAPLYTSVGMYIYPYLNLQLLRGKRIVVVCQNEAEVPYVINNLEQGFARITRTHHSMWKILSWKDLGTDNQAEVLVLTPQDFGGQALFNEAKEFLSRVSTVLLPDVDRVVSSNNYICQIISQRLQQTAELDLQFIFMATRNVLNLSNAVVEFFLLPERPVLVQGDHAYGEVQIFVWKSRGENTVILDNSAQTMLPEVGLSAIAAQHGIPNINVLSDGAIYSNQINPQWLDIYDSSDRPVDFTVVADENYNLPNVIYAYSRYAGKSVAVLHIISRPYMLLDYFYSNAERWLYERPLIEQSITEHAEHRKTRMLTLLCKLIEGIPLEQFMQRMAMESGTPGRCEKEPSFGDISTMVDRCLTLALEAEPPKGQERYSLYEREYESFEPVTYIRIREEYDVFCKLMEDAELVKLRFKEGREPVHLGLFRRLLGQRYLVGQHLVYNHEAYVIQDIDYDAGTIYLDDANSVHGLSQSYIQCRKYTVMDDQKFAGICRAVSLGEEVADGKVNGGRFRVMGSNRGMNWLTLVRSEDKADLQGDTTAYYMLQTNAGTVDVSTDSILVKELSKDTQTVLRRKLGHYMYVCMETGMTQSDRLTMTVTVMMQEVMKTLFPDIYFCLSVCPILKSPKSIYESVDPMLDLIVGMYPKVEGWTAPREGCVEFLIIDDCEGGNGIMELLCEKEAAYLQNVFWMLGDYLKWQQTQDEHGYLYFGMDHAPDFFDFKGAEKVFSCFAKKYIREQTLLSKLDTDRKCDLCGDTTIDCTLWNKKNICQKCADEYTPNADEAKLIAGYILKYLKESFGVEIAPVETVQAAAEELHDGAISSLDIGARKLLLLEHMPLTAVHQEILCQLVRLWQHDYLDITGDAEFEGQTVFVLQQYLPHIHQHQRKQRFYRKLVADIDEPSRGYCALVQKVSGGADGNSFVYMIEHYKKAGTSPTKPTIVGKSTRQTRPEEVSRYYYNQLSDDASREAYTKLYEALVEMKPSVDIPVLKNAKEPVSMIRRSVIYDHPEIFWTNSTPISTYVEQSDRITVNLCYTMDAKTRAERQRELDYNVEEFMRGIHSEMGDYEVALAAFNAIVDRLDYDTLGLRYQEQNGGTSKTVPDDLRSVYGAIVHRKAVCAGYARAYQYMLQKVGMECMYVNGDCTSGERHAWNIVNMEGEYYHVDVTWGDGSDTDSRIDRPGVSYFYFGLNDREIHYSRTTDKELPVPPCVADNCNYYVRNGLYFSRYDHEQVCKVLAESLKNSGGNTVSIRFDNGRLLKTAENHLVQNGGFFEVMRASGRESRKYSWNQNKDLCIIRFILEE